MVKFCLYLHFDCDDDTPSMGHLFLKLAQLEIDVVENEVELLEALVHHGLVEVRCIFVLFLVEVAIAALLCQI